jgi:predicted 3-demethylubiquinone-9 3-methyltransferase (glyoxalase superfamily)
MPKIQPCLWFKGDAEEALAFYASVFTNCSVSNKSYYGEGAPMPAGTLMAASFSIEDQSFMLINGGPQFSFSEAVSFVVNCDTQEELDGYWDKLSNGGQIQACGWLKDKYGLSWQIVPRILNELMNAAEPKRASNVMQALWEMEKIDIAALKAAYEKE